MKKNILLLICAYWAQMSFAQGIEWENTIGGSDGDVPTSVIILQNNEGYLLGGHSNSTVSGDKTAPPRAAETSDYWLVKLDMSGQVTWQTVIGGEGDDYLTDIKQLPDGGFIMIGGSISGIYADKTDTCRGDFDYWIVRINAMGDILWQKTYGGSREDFPTTIQLSTDGGFVVGGYSYSDISGDKTENNHSLSPNNISINSDLWILKLDSIGNLEWQNTIGGNYPDYFIDLKLLPDGRIMVLSRSSSGISGDKADTTRGGNDYWILQLDTLGNIIWQKTYGSMMSENPNNIVLTSDGGYLVSGTSNEGISGDKTVANRGGDDIWLIKLNSIGELVWQKTIGGSANEYSGLLYNDKANGFFILSHTISGLSGDKTEACQGLSDMWVLHLNETGDILWDNTIGGSLNDVPTNLQVSTDNTCILSASSASSASGDKSENSQGSADFWIVKLNNQPDNTATEDVDNTLSSIRISPNPTINQLQIDGECKTATLYNLTGQLVLSTSNKQLYLGNLAQGMYVLCCYDEQGRVIHREKVIKQ